MVVFMVVYVVVYLVVYNRLDNVWLRVVEDVQLKDGRLRSFGSGYRVMVISALEGRSVKVLVHLSEDRQFETFVELELDIGS